MDTPGPQYYAYGSVGVARTRGRSGRQRPFKPYVRTDVHQRICVAAARNFRRYHDSLTGYLDRLATRPSSNATYANCVLSAALAVALRHPNRQPTMAPQLSPSDNSGSYVISLDSMNELL